MVAQDDWGKIAPWVMCSPAGVEVQGPLRQSQKQEIPGGRRLLESRLQRRAHYLFLFETRSGPYNYSGYSNPAYDRLVVASDNEPDLAKRAALMAQAEQTMLDDAPFCMVLFGASRNLVHPDLTGWADNLEDVHRARWFGIRT